jgi:hypothetical protein
MACFFFKSRSFIPEILHDDSDDDLEIITRMLEEEGSTSHCGGTQSRRHIMGNRLQGHERLMLDYFAESPIYPPRLFRRRFRTRRPLFFVLYPRLKITSHTTSKKEMQLEYLDFLPFKRLPPHSGC